MERNGAPANLPNVLGSRYKDNAVNIHCRLMRYLIAEGRVDRRLNHVRET